MQHLLGVIVFGLAAGYFSAAIHTLDPMLWRAHVGRWRKALRHCDISDKEAAATMGMSPAQFSRQMAGLEKLAHPDTMLLPAEVHAWHAVETLNAIGLPGEIKQARSWLSSDQYTLNLQGEP
jgi:hypothetical protein